MFKVESAVTGKGEVKAGMKILRSLSTLTGYCSGGARKVPLKVVFVILKYYLRNVVYTIPT